MGVTAHGGNSDDVRPSGETDPFQRAKAVRALGRHADPLALDQLLALLDDPEWMVVKAALGALRRYRDPRVVAGAQAVLRDDTYFMTFTRGGEVSYVAARALRTQGEEGFQALLTLLRESREDEIRGQAVVWQLAVMRDSRAIGPLIETFDSPVFEVANRAAAMMRHFGADAIPPLIAALSTDDDSVRYQIIAAFRGIGASAVPLLLAALKDESDPNIRSGAASVLGMAQSVAARETLYAALDDSDEGVRHTAMWSLGQLSDPRVVDLLLAEPPGPETRNPEPATTLAGIGAEAAPPLISALEDMTRQTYQRINAAQALALANEARAVPPLVASLHDSDEQVRVAAASALGDLKNAIAVDPLLAALDGDTPAVRATAAYALAEIGDDRAFKALSHFVRESEGYGQRASGVLQMLAWNYHERALPLLREMALGDDVRLRIAAVAALGQLGAVSVSTLLEVARDPRPEVHFGTFHWLEMAYRKSHDPRIVDYFFEVFQQATSDKMAEVRRSRVVFALGACGDRRAVEPLLAMLQDPSSSVITRIQAIQTLGNIGDERTLGVLLAAYEASKAEAQAAPNTGEPWQRNADYQDALLRAIMEIRSRPGRSETETTS